MYKKYNNCSCYPVDLFFSKNQYFENENFNDFDEEFDGTQESYQNQYQYGYNYEYQNNYYGNRNFDRCRQDNEWEKCKENVVKR